MLGKAGLAVLALIPIFGVTQGTDLREVYNQMYPVNALKRDAFSLCHESDANFVRAFETDRESCYGRMPHSIALAIGYIRPGAELAALGPIRGGAEATALFLAEIAVSTRQQLSRPRPMPTSLADLGPTESPPCGETAAAPSDALARIMPAAAIAFPSPRGDASTDVERAMLAAIGIAAPNRSQDAATLGTAPALPVAARSPAPAIGGCGTRA